MRLRTFAVSTLSAIALSPFVAGCAGHSASNGTGAAAPTNNSPVVVSTATAGSCDQDDNGVIRLADIRSATGNNKYRLYGCTVSGLTLRVYTIGLGGNGTTGYNFGSLSGPAAHKLWGTFIAHYRSGIDPDHGALNPAPDINPVQGNPYTNLYGRGHVIQMCLKCNDPANLVYIQLQAVNVDNEDDAMLATQDKVLRQLAQLAIQRVGQ